jgi:tetratricopeptide (TPR) repeat protein
MVGFFKSIRRQGGEKNSELSKDLNAILEKGQELVTQKKITEALVHYQKALEQYPGNVEILQNIGDGFKSLGKYEDAIRFYDKALEIDPNNLVVLMNGKARVFWELGRLEEEIECCKIGLKIDPKNVHILNTIGGALSANNDEEAMKYIDKALEIEPENIMALLGKGGCCINMERYDEAKKLIDKVLELSPNEPMGIFFSADIHLKKHPELSETPEFKELREWRDNFLKKIPQ